MLSILITILIFSIGMKPSFKFTVRRKTRLGDSHPLIFSIFDFIVFLLLVIGGLVWLPTMLVLSFFNLL